MGLEENKTAGSTANTSDAKKTKKRSFELKERCQDFSAEIFNMTVAAPKELRSSICKRVQDIACEVIHTIRLANTFKIGSTDRRAAQQDSLEMLERLGDLLPVLAKTRCITFEQEAQLEKKLKNIRQGFDIWLEKDKERLEQFKAKKSSVISVQEDPSSKAL